MRGNEAARKRLEVVWGRERVGPPVPCLFLEDVCEVGLAWAGLDD